MPKVSVEGVGTLNFPDGTSDQEIQEVIDRDYNKPKQQSSALGAGLRAFGTSVGPTGAGMAAAAPLMPYATAAAPATYGLSYLVPLAVGGVASWAAEKAQKPILEKAFPNLEAQQQADVQQHKYATMAGHVGAMLPFAEFAPQQGLKALASIPAAIKGSKEALKDVGGLGLNVGLQEAMAQGQKLATGGGLINQDEALETALMGVTMGKFRGPLAKMAGHGAPEPRRPDSSPEVRVEREKELIRSSKDFGKDWSIVDDFGDGSRDVAHTDPKTGDVTVSRRNLHEYLDQVLRKDVSPQEAIDDLIKHETKHAATPDELALEFAKTLSPNRRYFYKRSYLGESRMGEEISEVNLGKEGLRFEMQKAADMSTTEYLSSTKTEKNVVKFLDVLTRATDKAREMLGDKGTKTQKELVERARANLKANLEAAKKGAPDASSVTSPEGISQPQEGAPVGQETRVRQQGETAPAQEAVAKEASVPLREHEAQDIIDEMDRRLKSGDLMGANNVGNRLAERLAIEDPNDLMARDPELSESEANDLAKENADHNKPLRDALQRLEQQKKAPPAAPTGEAQTGKPQPGSKAPEGAATPSGPAATATVSTTSSPVQSERLAELQRILRIPDRIPTPEEFAEYKELTKEARAKSIAEAKARRSAPAAMTLKRPTPEQEELIKKRVAAGVRDEDIQLTVQHDQRYGDTTVPGYVQADETHPTLGNTFSSNPEYLNSVGLKIPSSKDLMSLPQGRYKLPQAKKMLEESPAAMTLKGDIPDKDVAEQIDNLFNVPGSAATFSPQEREARSQKMADFLLSKPPEKRAAFLNEYQKYISKAISDRAAKDMAEIATPEEKAQDEEVDKQIEEVKKEYEAQGMKFLPTMPAVTRDMLNSGMIAHLNKKPSFTMDKDGKLRSSYGDYDSYVKAIRKMERTRTEQTGNQVHIPEEYIRQAWHENLNDFLNNASPEQLTDLMRVHNRARVDPKTGKTIETVGDVDASGILKDPVKLQRYAQTNRLTPEGARQKLEDQIHRELQYAYERTKFKKYVTGKEGKITFTTGSRDIGGIGKVEKEDIRAGRAKAQQRRLDAITFLSDAMDVPPPPKADPLRNKLTTDDLDSYTTLTEAEANDTSLLRQELWRGTSVKGKTVSKFSLGVLILVDPKTGEHEAVSFYQHPTSKDIRVNDPRFLPGDRTHEHVPLNEVLGEGYRIKALMMLNSPVTRFHQRWKNESAFLNDIGQFAKSKETLSGLTWTKYQREVEARERAAVREREGIKTEEEEKLRKKESEVTDEPATPETGKTEAIAQEQAAREEEEGMRPGEAGYEEAPGFESQVQGDKRLLGPGHNELAIDKTDPAHLARGPLTSREAEAIANTVEEHSKGRFPINKPTDMIKLLRRIQSTRGRPAWFGSKQVRGLRGQDYCFATGLDKMARFWEARLVRDNRETLRNLPKAPQGKPYGEMTNAERARIDFREELRQEALMQALDHIYELTKESKKAGVSKYAATFRKEALEIYGDTSRRDAEWAAIQKEHAAKAETISGERSLLGRPTVKPPEPVVSERTLFGLTPSYHYPENRPVTGEKLKPSDQWAIQGGPKKHGKMPFDPQLAKDEPPTEREIVPKWKKEAQSEAVRYYNWLRLNNVRNPMEGSAMTLKGGVGPSNRVRQEMVERGMALPVQSSHEPYTRQEVIESGQKNWVSWADTMKMMNEAQEGGLIDPARDPFVARYGLYLLDKNVDQIAKAKGMNSAEFNKAMNQAKDFAQMFHDTFKTPASKMMLGFQGEVDPTSGRMQFIEHIERVKNRKLTHEEMGEVADMWDDIDGSVGETQTASKVVAKKAVELASPPLEKGQQEKVKGYKNQVKDAAEAARRFIEEHPGDMLAMAAKGDKGAPPPLPDTLVDALSNVGLEHMTNLSDAGEYTEKAWTEAMQKEFGHRFDAHLENIRAVVEKIRDESIKNYMGTGDVTKEAVIRLTRKKPTVEASKAAIQKALEADPAGRHITNIEAFHIWNYLKQTYFDKGMLDFKKIRMEATADLGIKDSAGKEIKTPYTQLRLFRAMTANRSLKKPTEELITKMMNEARIKGEAANWLKNQEYPNWLRTLRMFPRLFFFDKIMGHGLVPMITHAPTMMFNPQAWSVYFGHYEGGQWKPGAWQEMYRMTFGTDPLHRMSGGQEFTKAEHYHYLAMEDLKASPRFDEWKEVGLQADPFKHSDDYQIEALQKVFGKKMMWLTAGRGFDALKMLRYSMAEKWLQSLPEHLRNKESMALIADSVNHATGIVKTNFRGPMGEALNWTMFAPKLEASRWAYLFKDPIKALDIVMKGDKATQEQQAWARSEIKQKALVAGWYYGMLALNQAFLKMSGSKEDVNAPFIGKGGNPFKSDFMAFKVAGFKVGVASPLIGVVKLLANMAHASVGHRTKYEKIMTKKEQIGLVAWDYGTGKASPIAAFGLQMAAGHDFQGRPIGMPWSEPLSMSQRMKGKIPYSAGEYLAETLSPLPVEELVKDAWRSQGMDEPTINRFWRGLVIGGGMGLTGARITPLGQ